MVSVRSGLMGWGYKFGEFRDLAKKVSGTTTPYHAIPYNHIASYYIMLRQPSETKLFRCTAHRALAVNDVNNIHTCPGIEEYFK